jgi:tetratricopeptide (TPR) repeat protein
MEMNIETLPDLTKAEEQWREVVRLDPDHWKASFSLGNNFAYYPDVMGKTAEAIHYLEEARRIQEGGNPRADEVRVYLALSRLHLRQGDRDRARAILESGLRRHPADPEILEALEELESRGG